MDGVILVEDDGGVGFVVMGMVMAVWMNRITVIVVLVLRPCQ